MWNGWRCASQTTIHNSCSLRPAQPTGGSGQPGRGLPAAVQHALPHAVVLRAGAAAAQRGRGLAASADRRADISGHQLRLAAGDDGGKAARMTIHFTRFGSLDACNKCKRTFKE